MSTRFRLTPLCDICGTVILPTDDEGFLYVAQEGRLCFHVTHWETFLSAHKPALDMFGLSPQVAKVTFDTYFDAIKGKLDGPTAARLIK